MLIEIKHRYNGSVLFSYDVEGNTVQKTIVAAVRRTADLRGLTCKGLTCEGLTCKG